MRITGKMLGAVRVAVQRDEMAPEPGWGIAELAPEQGANQEFGIIDLCDREEAPDRFRNDGSCGLIHGVKSDAGLSQA